MDHDYVLSAARLLKEAGTQELHLLTSQGSNPGSWLLYPSTKGKVGLLLELARGLPVTVPGEALLLDAK